MRCYFSEIISYSLFFLHFQIEFCNSLRNVYPIPKHYPLTDDDDCGEPLFLSPLLKNGRLADARNLSTVRPFLPGVRSNAGFFTVNETYDSNLFFWFFRKHDAVTTGKRTTWENASTIVWLQGGPGSSSLFGLFTENGPLQFDKRTGRLRFRRYSWTVEYNVLYIDNPVGSGFSYTASELGYARNQRDVAVNLYAALVQFFQLYPELRTNDLYLTGESYAGKYIPAFAYYIRERGKNEGDRRSGIGNLKGLAVGNGLCDPINMMDYGKYLSRLGLIDRRQEKLFAAVEERIKLAIKDGRWIESHGLIESLILDDEKSLFANATGFPLYYDYRFERAGGDDTNADRFVQKPDTRKALHVGRLTFNDGQRTYDYLKEDVPKSVKTLVEELLESYPIMFYSGQVDIIVPYPLSENFFRKLSWNGALAYEKAVRKPWYVDGQLAGYYKAAGNLTNVLVRRAGHMVPTSQPMFALELLRLFTRGEIK